MRAVLAKAFGSPSEFRIEELPMGLPGPGQIRISVRAAGISFVDVLIAAGRYQIKPPLPFVPGTEFSGVVDTVGAKVTGLKAGDRVFASAMGGAFAEQAIVDAGAATRMPPAMSFQEGSVFRVSYSTAYHALAQRARLQAGETVLVLGSGGAIGQAAVQIAKALHARVIASASSEAKRRMAKKSGADEVVDSSAANWREQVKSFGGGRGVDVVVDPVGGSATEPAFRSLGWKGRHLIIGFAAGEIPRLPVNLALLKGADLIGVDIRQFGIYEPGVSAANFSKLLELYGTGSLRPQIAICHPFEHFAEAMNAAADGTRAGRVVLDFRAPHAAETCAKATP